MRAGHTIPRMTAPVTGDDYMISDPPEPPSRRRRVLWIGAAVLVMLVTGGLVWWNVEARSVRFMTGAMLYADHAWEIRAGDTTEYCIGMSPGETIRFGFSLDNTSSHAITVTDVDVAHEIYSPAVTMSRINQRSTNPEGPEQPFSRFVLAPGQEVLLHITLHVPADLLFPPGHTTSFNTVHIWYRVLHVDMNKDVPMGFWIALDRPEAGALPCQPTPPVT